MPTTLQLFPSPYHRAAFTSFESVHCIGPFTNMEAHSGRQELLAIESPSVEANAKDDCCSETSKQDADLDSSLSLKRVRRKIDWRIVPLMFLCYTIQFLDRASLNYARPK